MNTPKIGSAKMARAIATFKPRFYTVRYSRVVLGPNAKEYSYEGTKEYLDNEDELPEGWKYLGHGATRIVFLGPDGVAYKRGYAHPNNKWSSRRSGELHCTNEAYAYPDLLPKFTARGIHIPACRWYSSVKVLAMEHLIKERNYLDSDDVNSRLNGLGFWDIHEGNVWFDTKGRLVVVDYA